MTQTRRAHLKMLGAGLGLTALPSALLAEDGPAPVVHEVLMLNKHPDDSKQRMVFLPDIVRANPGDTIKFVTVDKGHNSVSNEDMIPEGGQEWAGKISKDVEVTITTEGAYGYFCTPHKALGMVGLILVGDVSANYEAVKAVPQKGKTKKVFKDIFERADALLAAEA